MSTSTGNAADQEENVENVGRVPSLPLVEKLQDLQKRFNGREELAQLFELRQQGILCLDFISAYHVSA